ncbi:MAG: LysR family transcriptional regulator [Pseudomonadota bacterium]
MRRRLPPLNSLLAFEAAARHSNFSKAARELGVAQPAITRHIANLEDWLDAKLFKRSGNAVELSLVGYELAEVLTPTFDRLELGFRQFSAARENEILIGASFGIMHMWLMPQITAMRGAAGGATVNFLTSENYSDFDKPEVDFSIRFGTGDWPGKNVDLIFTETTHVIASPQFLRDHPSIDENDLPGTLKPEWLLEHGDPRGYGWMTWELWFAHHNREVPQTIQKRDIHNYPTILDMVRCGEGVALGYVGLDDALVNSGEVIRLGKPLSRPDLGYYLLSDAKKKQTVADRELIEILTSLGR